MFIFFLYRFAVCCINRSGNVCALQWAILYSWDYLWRAVIQEEEKTHSLFKKNCTSQSLKLLYDSPEYYNRIFGAWYAYMHEDYTIISETCGWSSQDSPSQIITKSSLTSSSLTRPSDFAIIALIVWGNCMEALTLPLWVYGFCATPYINNRKYWKEIVSSRYKQTCYYDNGLLWRSHVNPICHRNSLRGS